MLIFIQGGFQSVTKTENVIGYHRMCNVRGIQSVMELDNHCKPTDLEFVDVLNKSDVLLPSYTNARVIQAICLVGVNCYPETSKKFRF